MTPPGTSSVDEQLGELIAEHAHPEVPAGSAAVVHDGQIHALTWGCEPGTLFQAASISKPVAAVTALALAARGDLDIEADVNTLLTSWQLPMPDGRPAVVTVRDILCHGAALTTPGFPGYPAGQALPSLVEILDGTPPANTPAVRLRGIPGLAYSYSGGGYTLLELLLRDVTGAELPELAAELVLGPAGMTTAQYGQPEPGQAAPARSMGRPVPGGWHVYPERAAAGLWCTPVDLVRFAVAVQASVAGTAGGLLPADLAAEMLSERLPGSGLGWALRGEGDGARFSHAGSNEGYTCKVAAPLAGGRAVAVMTASSEGRSVIDPVLRGLQVLGGWADPAEPEPAPAPSPAAGPPEPRTLDELAARYEGRYSDAGGRVFTIGVLGWNWWLEVPGHARLPLTPRSYTRAVSDLVGAEVEFTVDDAGQATELVFSQLGTRIEAKRI